MAHPWLALEFCVIVGVLAAVAAACLLSWSMLH
jgi:hypothetical protein